MAGLYSRLNENGLADLRKGLTWRGIATPVISSSHENALRDFYLKVKRKMLQIADLFHFLKNKTLVQFLNRTLLMVSMNFCKKRLSNLEE
jgi:hypothetical protein